MVEIEEIMVNLQQSRYLVLEARDGSGALLDLAGEHSAKLSPSALFIVQELQQGDPSVVKIASEVAILYAVDTEEAQLQVRDCIIAIAALLRGHPIHPD